MIYFIFIIVCPALRDAHVLGFSFALYSSVRIESRTNIGTKHILGH
jgi:hypothetical protein